LVFFAWMLAPWPSYYLMKDNEDKRKPINH